MALKIISLTFLFWFTQKALANDSTRCTQQKEQQKEVTLGIHSCTYENFYEKEKWGFKYCYDDRVLKNKIQPLRQRVLNEVTAKEMEIRESVDEIDNVKGGVSYYPNHHQKRRMEKSVKAMEVFVEGMVQQEQRRENNEHCPLSLGYQQDEEIIKKEIRRRIEEHCRFGEIEKKCHDIAKEALKAICGKEKKPLGCSGGISKEYESVMGQIRAKAGKVTSRELEDFRKTRDKWFETLKTKLIRGENGFKQCAWEMRKVLENNDKGRNLCFDAYDIFLDEKLAELAGKNCTPQAVDHYEGFLITMLDKRFAIAQKYQDIKNSHVLARLCSLKLSKFIEDMDYHLKYLESVSRSTTSLTH